MNEINKYYGVLLQRFYQAFNNVNYQKVPICKYIHYRFLYFAMNRWSLNQALEKFDGLREQMDRITDTGVYQWSDEPYMFETHSKGVVLMRGGFGEIALSHLPIERCMLLSPNQAEVDVIQTNRPELTAHNIETFYRNNERSVAALTRQVNRIIAEYPNDPLIGDADFRVWLANQIRDIVKVLDAIQSIFESFEINSVLTISTIVWMDCALNLIARANRIPSFTLQHGLILERDLYCHIPVSATKKLVWGKANQEWYQNFGYPESRLAVIGSPRFDVIFNRKWCGKAGLCKMLAIEPPPKIAVYATGTDMETIVPIVLQGLEKLDEVFLIVLLHPSESSLLEKYQKLTEGFARCKVVRFGHISLYDALSGADFFITHCSTAGLEAMLFKLPVITVEPSPPPFSYGDSGASVKVTTASELHQSIYQLIHNESYRLSVIRQYQNFLARHCLPDGLASRRLFDEIIATAALEL